MNCQAVLFDLDGTLLDTIDDLADATNQALGRYGFPRHDVAAYKYFVGDGAVHLMRRALPESHRDEPTVAEAVAAMRDEYARRWADKTHPYDGVIPMLDALAERGLRLAVLSNKPDDFTKLCVARLLPGDRFELVVGAKPSVALKPDPAAALGIAAELGVAPAEVVYLGDTGTDMQTACAAGMYPVGALWGFRTADELRDNGARVLIEQPMDLVSIVTGPDGGCGTPGQNP